MKYFYTFITLLFLVVVVYAGSDKESFKLIDNNHCECENYDCGCCQHIEVDLIDVNNIVCANFSYLPHDYGLSVTVTYGSFTVFNETISARNPPPLCIGQPFVKRFRAEICIRLYNMDADKHHLHGCMDIEALLFKLVVSKYDLGCFDVGSKSFGQSANETGMLRSLLFNLTHIIKEPFVNMI